ncbi:MAG: undecaprenyl-diphosphate phosphatase [Candidatus Omnitrophica bacterium]|nr:undecaprenyl-diphosphate phosphatase [Candidatus Omnitrophota bacterium]
MPRDPQKTRLTYYLIVGTIPAVVLGLFVKDYMETIFRNISLVAMTLVIGSIIMYVADRFLKKQNTKELTLGKSIIIGFFQSLALVPGMSRSGMSISGGYFLGLSKEAAVRFSFLLSIPIIVGSGLIKVHDVVKDPSLINGQFSVLLIGATTAFIFGWFAIDFLLKYLKTNSFKVFVIYRIVLAIGLLILVL